MFDCILSCYRATRARPFTRRRLMTARPAFVDTRARNPCVRARCRLCGWWVRFGITNGILYRSYDTLSSTLLCRSN